MINKTGFRITSVSFSCGKPERLMFYTDTHDEKGSVYGFMSDKGFEPVEAGMPASAIKEASEHWEKINELWGQA
jgi:hypothetical protein